MYANVDHALVRHTDDPEIDEQIRAFGENMHTARTRAGLSQVALSEATQLDRAAISFLERAERSPDLSTIVRIAAALDCDPADLLIGIGSAGARAGDGPAELPRGRRPARASKSAVQLGANLRAARKAAGLSQESLAHDAGVDRAAISVYERGGRGPNLRTVMKLARALRLRPAALFEGVR